MRKSFSIIALTTLCAFGDGGVTNAQIQRVSTTAPGLSFAYFSVGLLGGACNATISGTPSS